MANLLTTATTDTALSATGTATGSDRVLIEIPGDSTMNGAQVVLEGSSVNEAAKFSPLDRIAARQSTGHILLTVPSGYFIRALLSRAAAGTSVTVIMHDV